MATYVLVAGAWLGGWAWRETADVLRAKGHDVYPVTLTGLGERAHLASPEVDQDTHIADVVGVLTTEDLHDVVLVGHSYAGITVTGAADRVPERIAKVVYLDSGPVADGMAYLEMSPPEGQAALRAAVTGRGDGWRLPVPSWAELEAQGASLEGLGDAERAHMRAHATDQPFATYTTPLKLTGPGVTEKVLVTCSFPLAQVRELIARGHPWFAPLAGPGWSFAELPTGHWPMFSVPGPLAQTLDELA